MKCSKRCLMLVVTIIAIMLLSGCSQASNATYQLKNDADEFKICRKITVINLRTDSILYEIEGRISYTVETDGDFSIIAQVGEDQFKRDVIGVGQAGNGITYIVEQVEPNAVDPYKYEIRLYARLPEITINQGEDGWSK